MNFKFSNKVDPDISFFKKLKEYRDNYNYSKAESAADAYFNNIFINLKPRSINDINKTVWYYYNDVAYLHYDIVDNRIVIYNYFYKELKNFNTNIELDKSILDKHIDKFIKNNIASNTVEISFLHLPL